MHEWTIECKVGVLTFWVSFRFWRNLNIVLRKCIISWRRKGHETFGAGRQNTAALGPPVIGNRKGGVETLLIRPRELVRAQGLHHYVPTACLTRALLILHVELVQHWNQAIREDKSLLKVSFFFGKSSLCGLTVDPIMEQSFPLHLGLYGNSLLLQDSLTAVGM